MATRMRSNVIWKLSFVEIMNAISLLSGAQQQEDKDNYLKCKAARDEGKYAFIRNGKVVIKDTPPPASKNGPGLPVQLGRYIGVVRKFLTDNIVEDVLPVSMVLPDIVVLPDFVILPTDSLTDCYFT